jgi:alpha-tubulin suppressor-like RCC1 family protein
MALSCTTDPTSPYDISKTDYTLTLQSSRLTKISDFSVSDTVGDSIRIGAAVRLSMYVDSISVSIQPDSAASYVIKEFVGFKTEDTLWRSYQLKNTGITIISTTAFIKNGRTLSDSVTIMVHPHPFNHAPRWEIDTIVQKAWLGSALNLTLTDKCFDPRGDTLKFSLFPGAPVGDTVVDGHWAFIPAASDTGTFFPRILAQDPEGLSDTVTLHLIVQSPDTLGPEMKLISPAKDSVGVNISSIAVTILCKDKSGVALVACFMDGAACNGSSTDSTYTAMVVGLKPNRMNAITFIATDRSPLANKDTLTIHINYDSTLADNIPPMVRLVRPSRDTTIGVDSCIFQLICKDTSGISSVTCLTGNNSFAAVRTSKTDSLYTAKVTGFVGGKFMPIKIMVLDASPAFNTCSLSVRIKYDNDMTPPLIRLLSPLKDSSSVLENTTTLQIVCKDASGVASLSCALGSAFFTPVRSPASDSMWSINISGLAADKYNMITVIAADSSMQANKDTFSVDIKYDTDTIGPAMTLVVPAKDSLSVNAASYSVNIACKDASGIAAMTCSMNGTSLLTAHNPGDSIWQVNASGLSAGQFNKIVFFATDGSARANRNTLTVSIKYDPTMLDSVGPTFQRISGPVSGQVVANPVVSIADSIVDPNNVDSVYWTLNGAVAGKLTPDATGIYRLIDTLTKTHLDTIIIFAQDKSPLRNKSSFTIVLDYNIPPTIADTSVSTNRNSPLTWTLNAVSGDGDPLAWSALSAPLSAHGAISGTFPNVIFTPATNWSGVDSFRVRVKDAVWSDTATVKITVVNVLVAPKDVRVISQPASDTVIKGQGIVFTATMNSDVNPAPAFQWNHGQAAINGATAVSYSLGAVDVKDTGTYSVTITNTAGSATSPSVVLVVLVPPTISYPPSALTLTRCSGDTVSFNVTVGGTPPFTYQWQKNGSPISGGPNAAQFTIASALAADMGAYTCLVKLLSGAAGTLSHPFTLTVNTIVSVAANPLPQTKWAGDTAILSVGASGTAPFTYQWKKGTADIPGAASPSCTLVTTASDHGASFLCVVANGCGKDTSTSARLTVKAFKTIAGGFDHSLFLRTDNTLWACGHNHYGQLGKGDTMSAAAPVPVTTITDISKISARYHSVFLKNDGTVWACGFNQYGQLGLGDTIDRSAPVQITAVTSVSDIATGRFFTLLLTTGGSLYACGQNDSGQLGDGTKINRYAPVLVASGVSRIAAGAFHSLIVKSDNSLSACGSNEFGQLGDGTNVPRITFKTIMTGGVSNIATGAFHSLILKSDATLWVCGNNDSGQLGIGTRISQPTPVQVPGVSAAHIAAGSFHSIILETDNTLWTCGDNTFGQMGDGTLVDKLSPVQVATNVSAISGGVYFTLMLKSDGSLWASGRNNFGQLGDATSINRRVPNRITW